MNIGLVRHYKVIKDPPSAWLVTAEEVTKWFREYDEAPISDGRTDLGGIEWNRCISSDITRAVRTAEKIFQGDIVQLPGLREIPLPPLKSGFRLPFTGWAVISRLAWIVNRQARSEVKSAREQVQKVFDNIIYNNRENLLIVTHGAVMMEIKKELFRRGFQGPKFTYPENGKLYLFTKDI